MEHRKHMKNERISLIGNPLDQLLLENRPLLDLDESLAHRLIIHTGSQPEQVMQANLQHLRQTRWRSLPRLNEGGNLTHATVGELQVQA